MAFPAFPAPSRYARQAGWGMTDISPIVKHYIALRDQKAEIEARHKEELEPIRKDMDMIEGALMKVLQDGGQKSAKTDCGTAYISEVESIKITNKDEVIDEVV